MIHIVKEKHTYSGHLRQEQMQRTREQILKGLVKTMARGIATVSIPAVAREAGVSIPTVNDMELTRQSPIALAAQSSISASAGNERIKATRTKAYT